MSRLVHMIDESEPSEEVLVLAGQYGVVTLHLPGGHPDCMVLHSPEEMAGPGWTGPHPCARMEMACWCLSSITGDALRDTLCRLQEVQEADMWSVMEHSYHLYLRRGRR